MTLHPDHARTEPDATVDAEVDIEDNLGRALRLLEAGLIILEPNEIGSLEQTSAYEVVRTARDLVEAAEAAWLKS
jgi:hypothetical protein